MLRCVAHLAASLVPAFEELPRGDGRLNLLAHGCNVRLRAAHGRRAVRRASASRLPPQPPATRALMRPVPSPLVCLQAPHQGLWPLPGHLPVRYVESSLDQGYIPQPLLDSYERLAAVATSHPSRCACNGCSSRCPHLCVLPHHIWLQDHHQLGHPHVDVGAEKRLPVPPAAPPPGRHIAVAWNRGSADPLPLGSLRTRSPQP